MVRNIFQSINWVIQKRVDKSVRIHAFKLYPNY